MFYQILLLSQVKRWVLITYKNDMYELPHKLPNDLRLRIFSKLGNMRKMFKLQRKIAQYPVTRPK